MEKVLLGTSQAGSMKASGRMITGMALDLKSLQITIVILVSIGVARSMAKANINGHLGKNIKGLGRKAGSMDLATGKVKMEIAMKASGRIIILMDMANITGKMAIFMKENGK